MAASSQLVQIELGPPVRQPKPEWLRAKAPVGENFHNLKKLARGLGLHTVCESAQCPNIGECWNHRTATFMLLGDICTRRCGFCAVPKGKPGPIDWDEPRRVAEAVATLGLKHAVVTSVNRDDDNVGGARDFRRNHPPDSRAGAGLPGRSSDPGFPGSRRGAADRARRAARRPEPQHRDRAAALSRRALGRALRAHAASAGECQEILARRW